MTHTTRGGVATHGGGDAAEWSGSGMSTHRPFDRRARETFQAQLAREYPPTDLRLVAQRASVAARLRRSGITLPSDEAFDALVLSMARFALHWAETEAGAGAATAREHTTERFGERVRPIEPTRE